MNPPPTRQQLIDLVEHDATGATALEQLAAAATTVAALEETGDAVLSHFVDRARRDGHSWSQISDALGVTKQAAHKRFSYATPALDRFTPRAARCAVEHAQHEARTLGHNFIGTEHLLLALYDEPDSVAAKVLVALGAPRRDVEREVLERIPRGDDSATGTLPYTPRSARALAATVEQALQLGHNYIGTEHIVLALLAQTDGVAAHVLTALGLAEPAVRGRIVATLAGLRTP